jgi:hypothetical protein
MNIGWNSLPFWSELFWASIIIIIIIISPMKIIFQADNLQLVYSMHRERDESRDEMLLFVPRQQGNHGS